jgi:hypothetical protein
MLEVLKQALEALKFVKKTYDEQDLVSLGTNTAIIDLKKLIAELEKQEPVAHVTREDFDRELDRLETSMRKQMQVKSVVMRCKDYDVELPILDAHLGRILVGQVTTPRKPLTEDKLKDIWYRTKQIMGWYSFEEIARAIEQAHGIKE